MLRRNIFSRICEIADASPQEPAVSFQETTAFTLTPKFEPERALRLGAAAAAAPIWAAYFAAASTGVAFWWATAWTRRDEQKTFAAKALTQAVKTTVEVAEAPVQAAAEIVETAPAAIEAPKAAAAPVTPKPAAPKAASAKPAAPKTVSAKSAAAAKTVRPKA
jgi:hypothetical protein